MLIYKLLQISIYLFSVFANCGDFDNMMKEQINGIGSLSYRFFRNESILDICRPELLLILHFTYRLSV